MSFLAFSFSFETDKRDEVFAFELRLVQADRDSS